ncbi:MAG: hypothetical protein NTY09_00440 [bacterium]|nr:hypothetical protein [bacterium]
MKAHCLVTLMVAVALVFGIGCSQGTSPVLPDLAGNNNQITSDRSTQTSTHSLLGAWTVTLDAQNLTADVASLRTAEFHLNILPFLEWKGRSTLLINNFTIDTVNNTASIDIGIKHPFPGLLRYSIFDTRGIIITDGTMNNFASDPEIVCSKPNELRITNADGMTRWWNPREFPIYGLMLGYSDGVYGQRDSIIHFSSTLNPFKYYSEDFDSYSVLPDDLNFDDRGVFIANGTAKWRHFDFDFGDELMFAKFNYLFDACWEWYDDYHEEYQPTLDDIPDPFFPISANSPEPFALKVNENENSLFYVNPTEFGGNLDLSVDVYDWQGMKRPDGIPTEVSDVIVESPALMGSEIVHGSLVPGSGDGHYSTWTADLLNCHPDGVDGQDLLVTVKSTEGSYSLVFGVDTKFSGSADVIAAYFLYTPVVSPDMPPDYKSITVVSPNGGSTYVAGQMIPIQWTWTGDISFVRIEYTDNYIGPGTTWTLVEESTPCDGDYTDWIPPVNIDSTKCRIKITSFDGTAYDTSDADFTIIAPTEYLYITNPVGGEIYISGDPLVISWDSVGDIPLVKIEYSYNQIQYDIIDYNIANVPGSNQYDLWDTNGLGGATVTIRISDMDNNPNNETDPFILERLTLDQPNSPTDPGYLVGQARDILWHTDSGGTSVVLNIIVELSKNSDAGPWNELYNGSNLGSYQWTPTMADITDTARIRITDPDHTELTDMSAYDFKVHDWHGIEIEEYQSYFNGTSYTYKGQLGNCSGLDTYLNGSTTTWDFVNDTTLSDKLGSSNFHVDTRSGSSIGHVGSGAPAFGTNDYAMRATDLLWPPETNLNNSYSPEWVYNFSTADDVLSVRGFDSYFEAMWIDGYGFFGFGEGLTTHQYMMYGSQKIQFPLDNTSGQQLIADSGTLYMPFGNYESHYGTTDSEFTVIGEGTTTVPMGAYEHSFLVVHKHGTLASTNGPVAITGVIMYQWISEDGIILAYIQTHNTLGTTRFDSSTGMISGNAIIGALVTY